MWQDGSCKPVQPVLDEVNALSRAAAAEHFDRIFNGDDVEAIGRAIDAAAFLIQDWEWVYERAQILLDRPNTEIWKEALAGLGQLARESPPCGSVASGGGNRPFCSQ